MSDGCPACGTNGHRRRFTAREMMFGRGGDFAYLECAGCGSLRIEAAPPDLARHYAGPYYSFAAPPVGLRRRARDRRAAAAFGRGGVAARLLVWRYGVPADLRAVVQADVPTTARVLDVGCGGGALLADLRGAGFAHLTGVDPFVTETLRRADGVTIWKQSLEQHHGRYDLVMMHHSLEHAADPLRALREARRLLDPGGVALVRVPIAASFAARTYDASWVQLDAPRHLFIPSAAGVRALAAAAGFTIDRVLYDSDAAQFWGSELYRRGLTLVDSRGRRRSPRAAGITRAQLAGFSARARELNAAGDGDQACFYLRPTAPASRELPEPPRS